jgi:hypothetical protein
MTEATAHEHAAAHQSDRRRMVSRHHLGAIDIVARDSSAGF